MSPLLGRLPRDADDETVGRWITAASRGLLLKRWGGHPEADDILAEARALAWESYRRACLTGTCEPAAAALNAARWGPAKWYRRSPKQEAEPFDAAVEEIPDETDWGKVRDQIDRRRLLSGLLAHLSKRERQVIALIYGRGCTSREAGDILGMKAHNVRVMLAYALKRCRQYAAGETMRKPAAGIPMRTANERTCAHGHEWSRITTIYTAAGKRLCRLCKNNAQRRYKARGRENPCG